MYRSGDRGVARSRLVKAKMFPALDSRRPLAMKKEMAGMHKKAFHGIHFSKSNSAFDGTETRKALSTANTSIISWQIAPATGGR